MGALTTLGAGALRQGRHPAASAALQVRACGRPTSRSPPWSRWSRSRREPVLMTEALPGRRPHRPVSARRPSRARALAQPRLHAFHDAVGEECAPSARTSTRHSTTCRRRVALGRHRPRRLPPRSARSDPGRALTELEGRGFPAGEGLVVSTATYSHPTSCSRGSRWPGLRRSGRAGRRRRLVKMCHRSPWHGLELGHQLRLLSSTAHGVGPKPAHLRLFPAPLRPRVLTRPAAACPGAGAGVVVQQHAGGARRRRPRAR